MKTIVREPLVHFLLIGAGLFLFFGWKDNSSSLGGGQSGTQSSKIVVTREDVDQLVARFTKTWQRPPSKEEVQDLVKSFVREEIFYRQALAIGLDRGDPIIRRMMQRKMEFIFEDVLAQVKPTDEDLEAFLQAHPEQYGLDPQIAFRQVYIQRQKRGQSAEPYARQVLAQLRDGADPGSVGDPLLLEQDSGLSPVWEIRKRYGKRFTTSLLELKPGRWQGPVWSEYGLHLVFISKRLPGRMPELNEVREAVERDWAAAQQRKLKDAAYARLRQRYTVEFEEPEIKTGSGVAEASTGEMR